MDTSDVPVSFADNPNNLDRTCHITESYNAGTGGFLRDHLSQVWVPQSLGAFSNACPPFPYGERLWSPWLGVEAESVVSDSSA